jgi:ATP-dependent DNA ligase
VSDVFANPGNYMAGNMDRSIPAPLGFIRPEIPTLVPEAPSGEGWIHEIKHDGYRTLIVIEGGKVRAFSRHGRDWTGPYRRVVEAAAKLSCHAALIDGEIIVQDENGISDFDATTQNWTGTGGRRQHYQDCIPDAGARRDHPTSVRLNRSVLAVQNRS